MDILDKKTLEEALNGEGNNYSFEFFDEIASTNTYLKENAGRFPHFHSVVANSQTLGRGRMGRSFFSPVGTGVYISVLLKDGISASDTEKLTTAAAVAACRAIRREAGIEANIKWINDIYIDGKKAAGILAEGGFKPGTAEFEYGIVGIGLNVYEPEGGFPEDIKLRAGSIAKTEVQGLRARLAAGFIKEFKTVFYGNTDYIDEYIKLNFIPGLKINVIRGEKTVPAQALAVDRNCHLVVKYEDGTTEALYSGEVSVRPC